MRKISRPEVNSTKNYLRYVSVSTTSKGSQPKFIDDSNMLYYKQDYHGYESLTEWVVYNILRKASTVPKELLVKYDLCKIDGINSCVSKDFKKSGEEEIPLFDLFEMYGVDSNTTFKNKSSEQILNDIIDTIKQVTSKELRYELTLMLAIDAFFLNEDRHLTNMSLIINNQNEFRIAPYFDNGLSLLSRTSEYPLSAPLVPLMRKVKAILPSTDFKKNAKLFTGKPFLYKRKILEFIEEYSEELGRISDILKLQMEASHLQHLFIEEEVITVKSSNIF